MSHDSTQKKPGSAAFRRLVDYIDEHHVAPPDMNLNGNMGDFHGYAEELLQALNDNGYDGFDRARYVLQRGAKRLSQVLA